MSKRKWRKGGVIHTLDELIAQGDRAEHIVYLRDRPCSIGWIWSMQLRTVMLFLNRGAFRQALPAEENDNKMQVL